MFLLFLNGNATILLIWHNIFLFTDILYRPVLQTACSISVAISPFSVNGSNKTT